MKRIFFNITLTLTLLLTISSLSALAQGRFVYTNNDRESNNSVSGFKVNANGTLELLAGSPQGMDGGGGEPNTRHSNDKIVVTERGPFLFASSDGDQEVASFHLNPNTGALTFIGTINLGDDGDDEVLTLAVAPNEQFLYVANNNTRRVHALRINNDGTLTELEVEQLSTNFRALEMTVSPNSKFLALSIFQNEADPNGRIVMFTIANDGLLTEAPNSSFGGSGNGRAGDLVFNCESNLLYVCKEFVVEKGVIDVFHVAQNGNLSQIQGSPFEYPGLGSAGTIDISPNGKYLFVGYGSFDPPRIGVFRLQPNGVPEVVVFSPFHLGYADGLANGPTDITVDATGTRLFVTYRNQHVEACTIDNETGRVTPVEEGVVTTGEDSGENTSYLASLVTYPVRNKCQIIPPADLTVGNSPASACGATVKYPAVTTCGSDCGPVTCEPPSGSMFAVGTHTVTCSSEGADDATFKVTVNDVTPPTIFQQPDIAVSTDPNKCSAVVNFTVSASDNCGTANTEVDFPSGSTFPKGETTVHITATDAAGNVSNYSFKVTVTDTQAPTLICQADIVVNNEPNKCGAVANYNLPMVSDNCPNVGAPSCNPPSGTFFPIGATTVTCTVTDSSQNQGQCTFKVTVVDVQAPQITCPPDKIVVTAKPCDASVLVNYPAPMATDNCPNVNVICVPPSGALFPVGTTTVTCTATDGGGNMAICSFKVTVYDVRVQDDANPNNVILFNSNTGEYRFCSPGTPGTPFTGVGTILKKGCVATLEHNTPERRVLAKVDPGTKKGNATLQSPPGSLKCTIIDKDITNNTTICQ